MKKFTALLALILVLGGCAAPQKTSDKPLVYASFYPVADFAAKLAGEHADVVQLCPDGAEPHDWEPTPKDMAGLEQADLFFYAGLGFESWVPEVLSHIQNPALAVVETGADVDALPGDPHFWLSPVQAGVMLSAMRDALVEIDPQHADDYNASCEAWAQELEQLDAEYRAAIDALPGREIVVAHAAFGYLCRDYGLAQVAARGFSPEQEPDPARLAEVITHCRENGTKIIFFESAASPQVAETIARETGAETAVLSPLEMPDETGADYFAQMRANLEQLKRALA